MELVNADLITFLVGELAGYANYAIGVFDTSSGLFLLFDAPRRQP